MLSQNKKKKKQSITYAAHKKEKWFIMVGIKLITHRLKKWRKEFPIILIMGFAYFDWDLQTLDFITNWRKSHHTPFHISIGIFNVLLLYHTKPNFLHLHAHGRYFKLNLMESLLINRAARSFRKAEIVLGHTVQPKVMRFNFTIFWRKLSPSWGVLWIATTHSASIQSNVSMMTLGG